MGKIFGEYLPELQDIKDLGNYLLGREKEIQATDEQRREARRVLNQERLQKEVQSTKTQNDQMVQKTFKQLVEERKSRINQAVEDAQK